MSNNWFIYIKTAINNLIYFKYRDNLIEKIILNLINDMTKSIEFIYEDTCYIISKATDTVFWLSIENEDKNRLFSMTVCSKNTVKYYLKKLDTPILEKLIFALI